MKYTEKQIKEGVKLHLIQNDRFKTNLMAVFLTVPLDKKTVTQNAILPAVLRRGTKNMQTQEEISIELEEMYGAVFDCGVEKEGDNQILKFYIEVINDEFIPEEDSGLSERAIHNLLDIVFNPNIKENAFKIEYVEQEKVNLKHIIEGKTDNKARYALERCIEEMYKNESYSLYKYGYMEDIENIKNDNLYASYKELLDNCKIDIYISGIINENIIQYIEKNENIKSLKPRNPKYIPNEVNSKKEIEKINIISENLDVTQGKLVLGLKLLLRNQDEQYDAIIYNGILGGTANSKLFQNVREKASLAYTAGSTYVKMKNTIYINCGIEIENYQKALDIIKKQIEDMSTGNFTEEEVENAKKGYISALKTIENEQDSELIYYFGKEFNKNELSFEDYEKRIEKVKKEDVLKVAKLVKIDTIYFLQNGSIKIDNIRRS